VRRFIACIGTILVLAIATLTTDARPPLDRDWTDSGRDQNGIPLNPRWTGQQSDQPLQIPQDCAKKKPFFESKNCTSGAERVTTDLANGRFSLCNLERGNPLRGHVNWDLGTYTGPIRWGERTDDFLDHEYCLELQPPGQRGLTTANGGTLHIEFDLRETISRFNTPWWAEWRDRVDALEAFDDDARRQAVSELVDDRDAIIVGLMGLDCEHDCQTELHPVYGMAIHARDSPSDDVWAVFARNWGNEGMCSRLDHPVELPAMTFRIPWRTNAASVRVADAAGDAAKQTKFCQSFDGPIEPRLTYTPNVGADLTLSLRDAKTHPRVAGELHLTWLDAQGVALPAVPRPDSTRMWPAARPWLVEPGAEHVLKEEAKKQRARQLPQEEFGGKDNVCTTAVSASRGELQALVRPIARPRLGKPRERPEKKAEEQRQEQMFKSVLEQRR
jgi:hypothetical protein